MDFWINLVIVVHVLVALAIIGLVLLQHGKGADMGSGFGGGASSSLFGATGSANFLSRATAVLAAVFFALSLLLTYFAAQKPRTSGGVMDTVKEQPAPKAPAEAVQPAPASAPATPGSAPSQAGSVPK
jgi:preprotein translocase subunit SecG